MHAQTARGLGDVEIGLRQDLVDALPLQRLDRGRAGAERGIGIPVLPCEGGLNLVGAGGLGQEVARAADNENWRRLTGHVRSTARGLARQGKIVLTRHGKPADPEKFKGVYRLRMPMEGESVSPSQDVAE